MSSFDINLCLLLGLLSNIIATGLAATVCTNLTALKYGFPAGLLPIGAIVWLGCLAPQPHSLLPVIAPLVIVTAFLNLFIAWVATVVLARKPRRR